MPENPIDTAIYDNRRTLVVGDVNTGKTRLTAAVLAAWTAQGRSREIAVLDLAPEARGQVGGPLPLPDEFQGAYRTAVIVPPRLQACSEEEAQTLAAANAAAITPLLDDLRLATGSILIVNDATLYLQAGAYDRLLEVLHVFPTAVINAYYGDSFPDYRLSRRERRLTERLMNNCDQVVRLPT